MSDTKEKLEDDFIEFWDTHAEKLGLGKYSSEIARFWLDKLDLAIAERDKKWKEAIQGSAIYHFDNYEKASAFASDIVLLLTNTK